MRRLASLVVGVALVLSLAGVSRGELKYSTTLLTNECYKEFYDLNDKGQVAFVTEERYTYKKKLYLYSNGGLTKITELPNGKDIASLQINNQGHVVWTQSEVPPGQTVASNNIYLYTGGEPQVINDNAGEGGWYNGTPYMNNNSDIIYVRCGPTWNGYGICLYSGGANKALTDHDDNMGDPRLNDQGTAVWWGDESWGWDYDRRVYRYPNKDGVAEVIVYDPGTNNCNPQIDDQGRIMFFRYDPSETPVYNLYLYQDGKKSRLTNLDGQKNFISDGSRPFALSPDGQAVWSFPYPNPGDTKQVFRYYNSAITQLTNDGKDRDSCDIASGGWITYLKNFMTTSYAPFVFRNGVETNVVTWSSCASPKINCNGQVVFRSGSIHLYLASPASSAVAPVNSLLLGE